VQIGERVGNLDINRVLVFVCAAFPAGNKTEKINLVRKLFEREINLRVVV